MTYYEELGLAPTVTQEEIRQADKGLARLLHPDQFQDPGLRRLAECQMQRLNVLMAVLGSSERRQEYDCGLAAGPRPPHAGRLSSSDQRVLAAAAAIILICLLLAAARGSRPQTAPPAGASQTGPATPRPPQVSRRPAPDRGGAADKREIAALRAEIVTLRQQRDRALDKVAECRNQPGPVASSAPDDAGRSPPLAIASAAAAQSAARELDSTHSGGLSGTWFYAPRSASGQRSRYPPEYIEAVIREQDGLLTGRYRALYRVPDRAISPEVSFQFRGRAAGDSASLEWSNADGARGVLEVRQLSDDSVEVKWTATELGRSLELASGRAILVRRRDP